MDTNLLATPPEAEMEAPQDSPEQPPMEQAPSEQADTAPSAPAEDIPEKFQNPETGEVRVDALVKSYQALERKLGTMISLPNENTTEDEMRIFRQALGVPDSPEEYKLDIKNEAITQDPDVNQQLFQAGFTSKQAQLVYDLAVEKVLPILENAGAEFEAERETAHLERHFGGTEKWRAMSSQLASWGKAHLSENIMGALSSTAEGILVMHRMMTEGEPAILRSNSSATGTNGESQLHTMMKDPRYWRDRDPDFIDRVANGFQELYPEPSET